MITDGADPHEYIERSIRRLQLGQVASEDGSWLEGVFGKAARRYEQWAKQKLKEFLRACSVDYDGGLRSDVPGKPRFEKLSLGQIASCFDRISKHVDQAIERGIFKSTIDYSAFCRQMFEINEVWKDCIKHGYTNLNVAEALKQLGNMKATIGDTVSQ